MATSGITESELLTELASSIRGKEPKNAKTSEELVKTLGLPRLAVMRMLKHYAEDGRLAVHKVFRPAIDGRQIYRPAYSILPAKKKK